MGHSRCSISLPQREALWYGMSIRRRQMEEQMLMVL